MPVAALVGTPEKGQLVVVRDRHWIVSDVTAGPVPVVDQVAAHHAKVQHLVSLVSVEDDGAVDDLDIVWEVEPGTAIPETATLPKPRIGHFDEPNRLAAFPDVIRWGAVTSLSARP